MTLKSAFEALGLVSIVASLVFVGMEIRQNTVVARGETLQALGGLEQQWILFLAEHHDVRVALRRWSSLPDTVAMTQEEIDGAEMMIRSWVRQLELIHRLYAQGLAEENALGGYGMGAPTFRSPRFREWWAVNRGGFDPSFVAFFDGRISEGQESPEP